ncbi:MAG TPA: universal stress protein [Falsiroseomonas sp.]|nr:universal stress protein [Falsiroseomonas sp.]
MAEQADPAAGAASLSRLLAATDLSSRADRALRRAAMLAQAAGAELLLLHAVDDDRPRSLVDAASREARRLLRDQAASLPELRGIQARQVIEEGDPFEAILRVSESEAVDLVVVGEHRRRLLRDIFVGTTLERVLRHGQRPVLTVRAAPAGPYRHVVAATDFSPHAARAIRAAERLGLLRGAELTVLHAHEPPGLGAMAIADVPPAATAAHEAEAARQASSALAAFMAESLPGMAAEQRVVQGRPATAIKDMVARLRPDLLVVGTTGAGALRRAVLGSVAAEVLGAVGCDALAVPPEAPR